MNKQSSETRIETDSMGKMEVSADRYWGAQTERSLQHFAIGEDLMPEEVIYGFGVLKKAAALANQQLGKLNETEARLIVDAAEEVIRSRPYPAAGTSTMALSSLRPCQGFPAINRSIVSLTTGGNGAGV